MALATPKASTPWPGMQDKLDMLVLVLVQTSRPQYTRTPHPATLYSHTPTTHTHTHTHTLDTHTRLSLRTLHFLITHFIHFFFYQYLSNAPGAATLRVDPFNDTQGGRGGTWAPTFLDVTSLQMFLIYSTLFVLGRETDFVFIDLCDLDL